MTHLTDSLKQQIAHFEKELSREREVEQLKSQVQKRQEQVNAESKADRQEPAASSQLSDSGVAMRKKLVCDANGCRLEDAPTSVLNDLLPATESGNPLLPTPAASLGRPTL